MIRSALAGLAAVWLLPLAAVAAAPEFSAALGRSLGSQTYLTDRNLAEVFAPELRFDTPPCQTASVPILASNLPVISALSVYADASACSQKTSLVLFEFAFASNHLTARRLASVFRKTLGTPCFTGMLPTDPRRHAPPRHLTAWRLPTRTVTLAQEDDGSEIAVSLLQDDVEQTKASPTAAGVRATFLNGLPAVCR